MRTILKTSQKYDLEHIELSKDLKKKTEWSPHKCICGINFA